MVNTGSKKELLIGCGAARDRRLTVDGSRAWSNLTTLDHNAEHNPDVVWDLNHPDFLPREWVDAFDEIHAYEVMEHVGQQGDYKTFFNQFSAIHRVLKNGGHFFATCPSRHSPWAWGDPSHTRIMQPEQLVFLSQEQYVKQVGKTAMSDFRHIYKADFEVVYANEDKNDFCFILRAIK